MSSFTYTKEKNHIDSLGVGVNCNQLNAYIIVQLEDKNY